MRSAALTTLFALAAVGPAQQYVRGATTGHDHTSYSATESVFGSYIGYYGDGGNSAAASWFQASFTSAKLFAEVNEVHGV